jgi:hypothetical protein
MMAEIFQAILTPCWVNKSMEPMMPRSEKLLLLIQCRCGALRFESDWSSQLHSRSDKRVSLSILKIDPVMTEWRRRALDMILRVASSIV